MTAAAFLSLPGGDPRLLAGRFIQRCHQKGRGEDGGGRGLWLVVSCFC